jgi:hypothetical protein
MADTKEELIRQRAHKIWEHSGYPEGDHESHWAQATAEVEAEQSKPAKPRAKKADAAPPAPAKKAAAKATVTKTSAAPKKPAAGKPKASPNA